jgi:S-adenosylmethionine hydrolase
VNYGDTLEVTIENDTRKVYKNIMIFGRSFADSLVGGPVVYVNLLDNFGIAINQGSFAKAYSIGTGSDWRITVCKATKIMY